MTKDPSGNFYPFGLRGREAFIYPMDVPHRHFEIEIFCMEDGNYRRSFNNVMESFGVDEIAIFWGLIPHQLIDITPPGQGFISYIPIQYFLSASLEPTFTQNIFSGHCIRLARTSDVESAISLLKRWLPREAQPISEAGHSVIKASLHLLAQQALVQKRTKVVSELTNSKVGFNRVTEMIYFVVNNFNKPIKAKDIGVAVSLNDVYARNLFKSTVGMTLREFLLDYRLDHAKHLLANTDLNILDVGFDSGFNSTSQFYANFKERFKVPPKEFRKALLNP